MRIVLVGFPLYTSSFKNVLTCNSKVVPSLTESEQQHVLIIFILCVQYDACTKTPLKLQIQNFFFSKDGLAEVKSF